MTGEDFEAEADARLERIDQHDSGIRPYKPMYSDSTTENPRKQLELRAVILELLNDAITTPQQKLARIREALAVLAQHPLPDEKKYTPQELLEMAQALNEALSNVEPLESDRLRHVLERYDIVARLASTVNKIKKTTDGVKNSAKALVIHTLDEEELDGAPVTIDGQKVNFSKYKFTAGNIVDRAAFEAWCREQDGEAFFEPEVRVRKELLNALVKQREDDGEELPPGVSAYHETRLSRTAKAGGAPSDYVPEGDE